MSSFNSNLVTFKRRGKCYKLFIAPNFWPNHRTFYSDGIVGHLF